MRASYRWKVVGILTVMVAVVVLAARWPLQPTDESKKAAFGTEAQRGLESQPELGPEFERDRQEEDDQDTLSGIHGSAISESEATASSGESARNPAEGARIRGRVEGSEGEGVARAVLTWTPLMPEWIDPELTTLDQDWLGVEARTSRGATQSDGQFELRAQSPAAQAEGSVLWATKPGFQAKAVLLDPTFDVEDLTVFLESAEKLEVIVQDRAGTPVESATVEYSAEYDFRTYGSDPIPLEKKAQLVLRRTPLTGPDGKASLPAYPDLFVLQARKGELVSDACFEAAQGTLVLTLEGTFAARGNVTFAPGVTAESGLQVTCRAREGYRQRRLAMAHVGLDGSWSIAGVPVLDVDAYHFRLNGEGVAVDEVSVEDPQVGDVVAVQLEARAGAEIAVHAANDLGQDLPGALVAVWWKELDTWLSTETRTDRRGHCHLTCCPLGEVTIQGFSDGHLTAQGGPVILPDPELGIFELVLLRAGTIRGTVRHLGQPVPDFELAWWVDEGSEKHQSVSGVEDGFFEITEVPPGEVWLIASSGKHAQSEPVAVTVAHDTPSEVRIELPEGLRGHGRIVSSIDRAPIPGTRVRLAASHMGRGLFYLGDPAVTGPDGRFEVVGLSPGQNAMFVEAVGHAGSAIEGFGTAGEDVDLGVIALNPTQRLTFRLLSEGNENLSGYRMDPSGPVRLEPRAFSVEGELVYEEAAPGDWSFTIWDPRGTGHRMRRRLAPGRDWLVEVPVDRGGEILVGLIPEPGSELPQEGWLVALYDVRLGESTQVFCRMPPDGEHAFPRLPASSVNFTAYDGNSLVIGSRTVQLSNAPSQTVEIELGGHRLVVQVFDDQGSPLPGTRVCASSLHSDGRWVVAQTTGVDGQADIGWVAFDEVLVHLKHPTQGSRVGVHLRPEELPNGLVVLEIDSDAQLQTSLRDEEELCPHVRALLFDQAAHFNIGEFVSDAGGTLRIPGLSEGPHILVLDDPRYWRSEHLVEASRSESPQPVEIRRLGSLSIEVLDPGGVPVFGLPVELISMEFGTPVAQWLSNGLVFSGESGLTTDLSGRIRLDGLPHGVYSWRIAAGSAGGLGGEVNVPGGEAGELIVRLP